MKSRRQITKEKNLKDAKVDLRKAQERRRWAGDSYNYWARRCDRLEDRVARLEVKMRQVRPPAAKKRL